MILVKIIGSVVVLSLFFMCWALPIQVCAFILYCFVIRRRIGRFLNPYVKYDVLVPIIVVAAWTMVGLFFSSESKSLANIFELFWLGVIWAVIICFRFLSICITKKNNMAICFWGNVIVLLLAVLSAVFFPLLPE
jgi:hypothetical protein